MFDKSNMIALYDLPLTAESVRRQLIRLNNINEFLQETLRTIGPRYLLNNDSDITEDDLLSPEFQIVTSAMKAGEHISNAIKELKYAQMELSRARTINSLDEYVKELNKNKK